MKPRIITLLFSVSTAQWLAPTASCFTAGNPSTFAKVGRRYIRPDNWTWVSNPAVHTVPSGEEIRMIVAFVIVMLWHNAAHHRAIKQWCNGTCCPCGHTSSTSYVIIRSCLPPVMMNVWPLWPGLQSNHPLSGSILNICVVGMFLHYS